MRNRRSVALVCAGLVCAGLTWRGLAQESANKGGRQDHLAAVLTDKEAFIPLPPEIISGPTVGKMDMSTGGRFLVVERQAVQGIEDVIRAEAIGQPIIAPRTTTSLIVWDSVNHRVRTVFEYPGGAQVQNLKWLSGSHTALALMSEVLPPNPAAPQSGPSERQTLLRINGETGTTQTLATQADTGLASFLHLYASPTQPIAILNRVTIERHSPDGADEATTEATYHDSLTLVGAVGQPVPFALPDAGFTVNDITWLADGSAQIEASKIVKPRTVTNTTYRMNPRTREIHALPPLPTGTKREEVVLAEAPALPVLLETRLAKTSVKRAETTENVGLLWLEGIRKGEKNDSPRALISSDSTGGMVLPGEGAVVFQSQGALLATPLARVPLKSYLVMRERALRAVAVSNAKQAGLAVIMYTQDYDETYPSGEGLTDKVLPYIKNREILDSMHYTYKGDGKPDPKAEIGYVDGPGGKAIIYGDGHVVWKDN